MVEYGRQYVLCNRVFEDVELVNRLVMTVYSVLGKPKRGKVRSGFFRKTKKFRVVITGRPVASNVVDFYIAVLDDDKRRYKHFERIYVYLDSTEVLSAVRKVVKAVAG